jgi:hypothetical protein
MRSKLISILALLGIAVFLLNSPSSVGSGLMNYGNTQRLLANNQTCTSTAGCTSGSAIVATTAATAIPVFTFNNTRGGNNSYSGNYSWHCLIKYNQATAGGGVGVAIASATIANRWTANARVFLTASTFIAGDSGLITASTAQTAVVAPAANTFGSTFPIEIDGTLEVAHVAPSSLVIALYSGSASNAITTEEGSYCAMLP